MVRFGVYLKICIFDMGEYFAYTLVLFHSKLKFQYALPGNSCFHYTVLYGKIIYCKCMRHKWRLCILPYPCKCREPKLCLSSQKRVLKIFEKAHLMFTHHMLHTTNIVATSAVTLCCIFYQGLSLLDMNISFLHDLGIASHCCICLKFSVCEFAWSTVSETSFFRCLQASRYWPWFIRHPVCARADSCNICAFNFTMFQK